MLFPFFKKLFLCIFGHIGSIFEVCYVRVVLRQNLFDLLQTLFFTFQLNFTISQFQLIQKIYIV